MFKSKNNYSLKISRLGASSDAVVKRHLASKKTFNFFPLPMFITDEDNALKHLLCCNKSSHKLPIVHTSRRLQQLLQKARLLQIFGIFYFPCNVLCQLVIACKFAASLNEP